MGVLKRTFLFTSDNNYEITYILTFKDIHKVIQDIYIYTVFLYMYTVTISMVLLVLFQDMSLYMDLIQVVTLSVHFCILICSILLVYIYMNITSYIYSIKKA